MLSSLSRSGKWEERGSPDGGTARAEGPRQGPGGSLPQQGGPRLVDPRHWLALWESSEDPVTLLNTHTHINMFSLT